jgi:hypothetical protein
VPHVQQEALAVDRAARHASEHREQIELLWRQRNRDARDRHRSAGEVDRQVADDDGGHELRRWGTAHHGLDASEQLDERERLDDVVVGAAAQTLDARGQVAPGGDDDHGNRPVTADLRAQGEPVAVG